MGRGDARASGTLSTTNAALSGAGNQSLKTADESFTGSPTVLFAANGANAEECSGVAVCGLRGATRRIEGSQGSGEQQ